jgi:hypothetical protein
MRDLMRPSFFGGFPRDFSPLTGWQIGGAGLPAFTPHCSGRRVFPLFLWRRFAILDLA